MIVLEPKGMIAAAEKHILIISVLLMLIVVIPVIVMSWVFAWRYRETNTKAEYAPEWAHSTILELIWWSIPCAIIFVLSWITWVSSHELDPYKPIAAQNKPLIIQAIALEWKWLFIYPEQNIATLNYLQFPVDMPIKLIITAEGPMNSLLIPQLAGQIYAMAGMTTQLHIIADEVGDYQGISANYSGEGFSEMKFIARASSAQEFKQWVQKIKQEPQRLNVAMYNKLLKPSTAEQVQYFSSANSTIFDTIVMKSMMPIELKEVASNKSTMKQINQEAHHA